MDRFRTDNIASSCNNKRITARYWKEYSTHGALVIDNDINNKTIATWIFKIHSLNNYGGGVCIGIDSSNDENGCAFDYNGSIGYDSWGDAHIDGVELKKYGERFDKNDIVTMVHNPLDQTITFSKEYATNKMKKTWYGWDSKEVDIKKGTKYTFKSIKINQNHRKYRMCVYFNGYGSSVELLSCEQYIIDNLQNDDDKKVNFQTQFDVETYSQKFEYYRMRRKRVKKQRLHQMRIKIKP